MKDDVKALVGMLRTYGKDTTWALDGAIMEQASDTLEAQQREIEGLKRQVTAFNQERFRAGQANAGLRVALHDAINAPKGVVPASAEPFYDQELAARIAKQGKAA